MKLILKFVNKQRIITITALVVLSMLFLNSVNNGDTFHHLRSGQEMLLTGLLPRTDTWSFTAYGKPWVNHSWGSGLLYAAVYAISGFRGLSWLFCFFGLLYALSFYGLLRRLGTPYATALCMTWFASTMLAMMWSHRPMVLAPVFVTSLLFLLTIRNERWHWILPPFFWLWSVLYGGTVIVGLFVLCLYVLAYRKWSLRYAVLLAACLLMSLLNGFGWASLVYVTVAPKLTYNQEWQPLLSYKGDIVFPWVKFVVFQYLLILLAAVWATPIFFDKHYKREDLLFYGVLATMALLPFFSFRHLLFAPAAIAPLVALRSKNDQDRDLWVRMIVGAFALFCTFLKFSLGGPSIGFFTADTPVPAVDALVQQGLRGNILSSQEWSSYIGWRMPDSKIFFDTRDDVFTQTDVFLDDGAVTSGDMTIEQLVDKYGVTVIIGMYGDPRYLPLVRKEDIWKITFHDDVFFAMVKQK